MRRLSVNQSAILLAPCALVALVAAQVSTSFVDFLNVPRPFFGLSLSITKWVADLLLALFFFVVGVELTQEFSREKSAAQIILPLSGAAAGMLIPALTYRVIAHGVDAPPHAWGIPMATDLPIALALLSIFSATPSRVRLFLLTLAIFDDLGSILVIAFKFTQTLSVSWLALALLGSLFFAGLIRSKHLVLARALSALVAIAVWYCTYKSGVHPTVAGALLGILVPARDSKSTLSFWEPVTYFLVLPLFVFTALAIPVNFTVSRFTDPVVISLFLARLLGKPIGIVGGIYLAVKVFGLKSPLTLKDFSVIGVLGTIGFSVSLLFADLGLAGDIQELAILAILVTLPIALISSYAIVKISYKN